VRELRNAVERAVVFEDTLAIQANSLPPEILRVSVGPQAVPPPKLTETYTAEAFKAMLAQSNAANPPPAPPAAETPLNPDESIAMPRPGTITPIPGAVLVSGTLDPAIMRGPADGEVLTLDEEEKRIILRTLSITGGNISDAARRLGVHRSTLHRKMTRYGLATDEQLTADALEKDEA
jgi:DNA-binding NtrC family response regulator